jgi:peptidoglycan L-alanyl-D-glutamate endopeptidase CwlK
MCYLAGVIQCAAAELGYDLRWGGNWDGDGEIIKDQKFNDLPHFEIE